MVQFKPELTGIPAEMWNEIQDCVIKQHVKNDLVLSRRKIPIVSKTPSKVVPGKFITTVRYEWADFFTPKTNATGVTINMIQQVINYVCEHGYEVKGKNEDGSWVLEREERHWEFNGQNYMTPFASIIINKEAQGCVFDDVEAHEAWKFKSVTNGVTTELTYTVEQIAASMGKTVAQVIALQNDYFVGSVVDLDKCMGSLLLATEMDNNDVNVELFVNGKPWTEIENVRSLVNSTDQPLGEWSLKYRLLNECPVPADHKDAESMGNFGECAKSGYLNSRDANSFNVKAIGEPGAEPSFDAVTRTFVYDSNKTAVLWISTHEEPFSGKEPSTEIWLDLKTGATYYGPSQASIAVKAAQ